jgi:ABC-type nitrate/sulfonate/bicarbonate transport system permease component
MAKRWPGFLLIVGILLLWELASARQWIDPISVPRVTTIASAWLHSITSGAMIQSLGPTLSRIASGFGLAVVFSIPLGLLMGTIPLFYRLFEPITEFLRPIPSSAYIPVAILFLGIDDKMKVFIVFLACIFPILLNTYGGVRAVDPVLIDTGRTLNVTWPRGMWSIVLPASLPSILTGMRISLGISLIVVVVAEMIAGDSGIGYYILDMQRTFRVPQMFAGIFTLGVLGYLFNFCFLKIEGYLLRWRGTSVEN